MNQDGETGLPPPAYIAVTQENARRGWKERRGGRQGGKNREKDGMMNRRGLERRRKQRRRTGKSFPVRGGES